jgi:putative ABC transport system permease protein
MLKNYIKTSLRYFFKNRVFSVVNILGLSIGFGCFLLLALFVNDELSFDTFHTDYDYTYRVIQHIEDPYGTTRDVAGIAPPIGPRAKMQFPEVLDQTRLIQIGRLTVGNDPLQRDYERIWIADENFCYFFNFEFVQGNPATALTEPDNVVITESVARKYFGQTDALGKTLYTNQFQANVAGVIKDFPANSHIKMNIIHTHPTWAREIKSWNKWVSGNWTSNAFITYLKMMPGFNKKAFENKLTSLVTANYDQKVEYSSSFFLQALADIHLYSENIEGGMNVSKGNVLYVSMFSIVAILILVIACFNYMNLSTAAAARRTREVAMRKTLGAGKKQLIMQFMGEALLLSISALILAAILIVLLLPVVNSLTGKTLSLSVANAPLLLLLLLFSLTAALLSAFYPAFFLARINPATALKSEIKIGRNRFSLRKILVITQFAVSITMISTTLIIYQQIDFLQQKDLGFNVNDRLVIDINSGKLRNQFESIKNEFEKLPEVKQATVSSRVPGEWKVFPLANIERPGQTGKKQLIFVGVDKDFLTTYNIKLLQGRMLHNDKADSNAAVLTQMAVRELGLIDPIGQTVNIKGTEWAGDLDEDDRFSVRIVGVVEDFSFESFRKMQRPIMLASYRNPLHNIDYYTLYIQTQNWPQTLNRLKAINNSFDPENPIEYTFLDNRFEEFYAADQIRGQLLLVFSILVIFIACMGLFALASFAIENRIKEIGVRKVLGAGVTQITWLLSSEFTMLVGLAFILSFPVSYWAVQNWLQEFAYRIAMPWWAFFASGLVALTIALLTISFQTIRAALANPIEALRYE